MKLRLYILALLTMLSICGNGQAATLKEDVSSALTVIGMKGGDPNLLLLTNAPCVKVDNAFALPYLNTVQQLTGCTVGRGNLLFFARPQQHALRFLLMAKASGKAMIINREKGQWKSEAVQLDPTTISSPEFTAKTKNLIAAKDMFTLASISAVWAAGGPYDFLKSAELHNHMCPGLTSGYLIAHYILNHFPLQQGERYTIIASPAWCKEDALQVILDCTAGKHGIVVKPLPKELVAKIAFANPAGMVLVWNAKAKTGKGYALTFNFDTLKSKLPKGSPKVAMVLAGLNQLGNPDKFVTTAASFDLSEKLFNTITEAGANPYEAAGLVKK